MSSGDAVMTDTVDEFDNIYEESEAPKVLTPHPPATSHASHDAHDAQSLETTIPGIGVQTDSEDIVGRSVDVRPAVLSAANEPPSTSPIAVARSEDVAPSSDAPVTQAVGTTTASVESVSDTTAEPVDDPRGVEPRTLDGATQQRSLQANHTESNLSAASNVVADATPTDVLSEPSGALAVAPPQADAEFLEAAVANKGNPEAEWQFDSSDDEIFTSDSDSDSSDDSDEAEDGYEMLDPATAARMLMAEEGGEDDDGQNTTSGNRSGLKTKNEQTDEIVPKPDITITEDMRIVPLGTVENVVMNFVVVRAFTSGEYQVLESGSALCLENRCVIGAVMETLGRVQEPRYTVAFTNKQEMDDLGIENGTKIFYVEKHSTFVFTEPLRGMKGTDASNIHDEEVGEDELEFSDDEMESAWKKYKKQNRQGNRRAFLQNFQPGNDDRETTREYSRGGASYQDYNDAKLERSILKYEDDDEDDMYTPLARPTNYNDMMTGRGESERGRGQRHDRGGPRGRGGRGRGFSGRGDRGRRGGPATGGNRGGAHGAHQPPINQSQPQSFQTAQPPMPGPAAFPPPPPPPGQYASHVPPPPPGWPQHPQQQASWLQSLQQNQAHGSYQQHQAPYNNMQPYQQQTPAAISPGSYVSQAFWGQAQQHSQQPQYHQQGLYAQPGQPHTGQDQTAALQAVMQFFQQNGAGHAPNGHQ